LRGKEAGEALRITALAVLEKLNERKKEKSQFDHSLSSA